jgi:hypothetical protein
VSRLFHTTVLVAALAALAPATALADGGVLLNGYAPPGAGEEALLGATSAGSGGAKTASRPAVAQPITRSAMPLAQASVVVRSTKGVDSGARHRAAKHARSTGHTPKAATGAAALPTASPAVVAAATHKPGGGVLTWELGLLAAALAAVTFGLARAWRRHGE